MKGITNELIGATAPSMVLAILKEGDSYGYEIVHKMKEMTEGKLKWQEATIYPILKQLENDGLITSYWKTDPGIRARKYFAIQEKGINKLYENKKEWNLAQLIFEKFWSFE
jgi:PadR family transcriptional regulator, regulatory protein PadR